MCTKIVEEQKIKAYKHAELKLSSVFSDNNIKLPPSNAKLLEQYLYLKNLKRIISLYSREINNSGNIGDAIEKVYLAEEKLI